MLVLHLHLILVTLYLFSVFNWDSPSEYHSIISSKYMLTQGGSLEVLGWQQFTPQSSKNCIVTRFCNSISCLSTRIHYQKRNCEDHLLVFHRKLLWNTFMLLLREPTGDFWYCSQFKTVVRSIAFYCQLIAIGMLYILCLLFMFWVSLKSSYFHISNFLYEIELKNVVYCFAVIC